MKIIELRSENVKKVKAIEIRPKDNIVVISGKNGQGKTSVLDSIWFALEGKASLKETPMPIRKGESKAKVELILDDFIVSRNWTDNDKSYLKVTNKEGLAYNSPQELLDSFIGKLSFDPLEFAQMKEKEQRDLLLQVADIDIDEIDEQIFIAREERRLKGQEVKLLSGEREGVTVKDLPNSMIIISDLQNQYEEIIRHNGEIDIEKNALDGQKEYLEELQEKVKKVTENIKRHEEYLKKNEFISVEVIRNKINEAEYINGQIKARERNKLANQKQKEAQNIYDDYTKKIDGFIEGKEAILKSAEMPISGLGISDTGVNYNDIPFGQLSSSEQLKVSLAIAMALNPKLKVIRITDGSLLDDDNMETIKTLAKEKDYQIWIEKVDGSGEMGFYIEEGEVKAIDGKKIGGR